MSQGKILIVDDDPQLQAVLARALEAEGYQVSTASDGRQALESLAHSPADLILTDLVMPGMDGLTLLRRVKAFDEELPVVLMTGFGDVDTAVAALRSGASDYLTKPLRQDELPVVLERALERSRLRREAAELRGRLQQRFSFEGFVASSPEMQRVLKALRHVAASSATIMLNGEPGTGKELVAETIHQHSSQAGGPFVRVPCATLAEPFLEQELFGGERGAAGAFERARAGTLFLDEVGELPLATQRKLVRTLEEREDARAGPRSSEARLIAASSRNLKEAVANGLFLEELLHRLNIVNLTLPPLRQRRADIPGLALQLLRRVAAQQGKPVRHIADTTITQLLDHSWPGNVGELESALEHAVAVCETECLEPRHLPPELVALSRLAEAPSIPGSSIEALERYAILKTLAAVGGSTSRAAAILGVSVRKIQYKLHHYDEAPG